MTEDKKTYLFVYGTSLKGLGNSEFLEMPERAKFLGNGTFHGTLHDIGPYPALTESKNGTKSTVKGEVYELDEPWTVLGTLDIIEGCNDSYPERSLFQRAEKSVQLNGETIAAQVYLYNQSVEDMPLIESGCYRSYIQEGRSKNGESPNK